MMASQPPAAASAPVAQAVPRSYPLYPRGPPFPFPAYGSYVQEPVAKPRKRHFAVVKDGTISDEVHKSVKAQYVAQKLLSNRKGDIPEEVHLHELGTNKILVYTNEESARKRRRRAGSGSEAAEKDIITRVKLLRVIQMEGKTADPDAHKRDVRRESKVKMAPPPVMYLPPMSAPFFNSMMPPYSQGMAAPQTSSSSAATTSSSTAASSSSPSSASTTAPSSQPVSAAPAPMPMALPLPPLISLHSNPQMSFKRKRGRPRSSTTRRMLYSSKVVPIISKDVYTQVNAQPKEGEVTGEVKSDAKEGAVSGPSNVANPPPTHMPMYPPYGYMLKAGDTPPSMVFSKCTECGGALVFPQGAGAVLCPRCGLTSKVIENKDAKQENTSSAPALPESHEPNQVLQEAQV
eukprot:GILK01003882.1.p1 GENE.GILK01003882.1~~GILK01003882.1.p1  ORF type:complete len:404 (+),score=53.63 GILK01003882.1:55-1266(+)